MVVRVPVQLMVRGSKAGLSNGRRGRVHAAAWCGGMCERCELVSCIVRPTCDAKSS